MSQDQRFRKDEDLRRILNGEGVRLATAPRDDHGHAIDAL